MSKQAAHNRPSLAHRRTRQRALSTAQASEADEYELKLDDQVAHFFQLNHTLTYFIITATVGTFGFTINLLLTNKLLTNYNPVGILGVSFAALASLLGAAASLIALRYDVESYRLHLEYRHKRKRYNDLTNEQRDAWDKIHRWAKWMRELSFVFLGFTVFIQFVLIIFLFIVRRESPSFPSVFSPFLQ
jgi:hypothetical protein